MKIKCLPSGKEIEINDYAEAVGEFRRLCRCLENQSVTMYHYEVEHCKYEFENGVFEPESLILSYGRFVPFWTIRETADRIEALTGKRMAKTALTQRIASRGIEGIDYFNLNTIFIITHQGMKLLIKLYNKS